MKGETGKRAFVLAGGGSLGAVHVGMLAALVDAGVRADLVVGSSVGALNGTFYAFHPDASGIRRLRELWFDVSQGRVFPLSLWSAFHGILGRKNGMVSRRGLLRILQRNLGRNRLEESQVECHVIAADAATGDRVVLSRGSALRALLASTAIPGVFEPVRVDGRWLFDGGVASNTPIRAAAEQGAREIVLLPTGCHSGALPTGPLAISLHALNILIARQLVEDMEALRSVVSFRVVPPLCPSLTNALDFSHSYEMIHSARVRTRDWIQSGGLDREEVPAGLLPWDPDRGALRTAQAAMEAPAA